MVRPMGEYKYILETEHGNELDCVKSPTMIRIGDTLFYRGNLIEVVAESTRNMPTLMVKLKGYAIEVESLWRFVDK